MGGVVSDVTSGVGGLIGDVVNPLTGQISNTNHYGAQLPPLEQQQFMQQIQQAQQQRNDNLAQQQQLASALQAQMRGEGPNLAQSQLNQATNQNIQQAAGLAASQKGINPALAARMGVQAGTAANQQAAGQSGMMRAQQQLAAQGQLGGLYNTMGEQDIQYQQMLQNALAQKNNTLTQAYGQRDYINSGVAKQNADNQFKITGGLLNSGGAALAQSSGGGAAPAAAAMSSGGEVPGQAEKSGDSYDNDTVPTMLSPGEIVVPRSKAKDPALAKEFIDHLMSGKGESDSEEPDYAKLMESHKKLQKRIAKLEKKKNG